MTRITKEQKNYVRSLIEKHHGHITPADLLRDAKRSNSPLHNLYDWNVERAARLHWLERSREILRTITVSVEYETVKYRAPFVVRDPDVQKSEQGYVSLDVLQDNKVKARAVMRQECERAVEAVQRIRGLAAALQLVDETESVLAELLKLKELIGQ